MSQTTLEWLLLPNGVTFSVFDDVSDGTYYPRIEDLVWAIPVAILLTLLRKFVVEKYVSDGSFFDESDLLLAALVSTSD